MPVGICSLCLTRSQLQLSHLLPAALYRIAAGSDGHPVVLSAGVHLKTSRQVRAHRLCKACEGRLHDCGEDWFLKHCWRDQSRFRLRDLLAASEPAAVVTEGACYAAGSIRGVDVPQLSHFALSVFWRGPLAGWRNPIGALLEPLDLGPYAKQLRQYLLGKRGIPDGIALLAFLTAWRPDLTICGSTRLPTFLGRTPEFHAFKFVAAGLTFWLLTGRTIPASYRRMCAAAHGLIHIAPDIDAMNFADALQTMRSGERRGAMARRGMTRRG